MGFTGRALIAGKGVADHVVPWSHGGRTVSENLDNRVRRACGRSRSASSLNILRAAAQQ